MFKYRESVRDRLSQLFPFWPELFCVRLWRSGASLLASTGCAGENVDLCLGPLHVPRLCCFAVDFNLRASASLDFTNVNRVEIISIGLGNFCRLFDGLSAVRKQNVKCCVGNPLLVHWNSVWELCLRFQIFRTLLFLAFKRTWIKARYLVDPASSHMLVSKIKPCTSKYKPH